MMAFPRYSLSVYGDINLDLQLRTAFHPAAGQDARVDETSSQAGGSAANCAAVAAHLGIPTSFIGAIGADLAGRELEQDLARFGVATPYLKRTAGQSGLIVALIDPTGERTFYSYRGANAAARFDDLPPGAFANQAYLHLSGYSFQDEESNRSAHFLLRAARQQGAAISLDASFWFSKEYLPAHPGLLAELSILFANQEEARLLSGQSDPAAAAQRLRQSGPGQVLVKTGADGCYLADSTGTRHIPAFQGGAVVDTTGAGDAFCAGYLAGQILGFSGDDSARLGNAAAAQVIGAMGGHTGAPDLSEMNRFLVEHQAGDLAERLVARMKDTINPMPL